MQVAKIGGDLGGTGHRQHGIVFMNSTQNASSCLGLGVAQFVA